MRERSGSAYGSNRWRGGGSKKGFGFSLISSFALLAVFRALMPSGIVFPLCFCYSQHHFWLVYYVLDGRRLVLLHTIPHIISSFLNEQSLHSFVEFKRDNIFINYSLHPLHCFTQKLLINQVFSHHGKSLRHDAFHISLICLAPSVYLAQPITDGLHRISTSQKRRNLTRHHLQ